VGKRDVVDPRLLGRPSGLGHFFPDSCTISRPGRGAFNAQTGIHPPTEASVYEGDCRVMPWPDMGRRVVAREDLVIQRSFWVSLPTPAEGIEKDDVVEVTDSADGELVGRRLVVRDVARGSLVVGRRLICQEVVG
jgi:hypothetical protein